MPLDEQLVILSEIPKITERYQVVKKDEVKIWGKIPMNLEHQN